MNANLHLFADRVAVRTHTHLVPQIHGVYEADRRRVMVTFESDHAGAHAVFTLSGTPSYVHGTLLAALQAADDAAVSRGWAVADSEPVTPDIPPPGS